MKIYLYAGMLCCLSLSQGMVLAADGEALATTRQCCDAATGQNIRAKYALKLAGVTVAESVISLDQRSDSYRLNLESKTTGLARLLGEARSSITATGRRDGQAFYPERYESEGVWSGESFSRRMTFDKAGRMQSLEVTEPPEWAEDFPREPVAEDLQAGPDPLSLLMHLAGTPLPRGQEMVLRAFTGDVVLDFFIGCEAGDKVPEYEAQVEGVTAYDKCALDFALVDGARVETGKEAKAREARALREKRRGPGRRAKETVKERERALADEPVVIWMASRDDLPALPVRIEGPGGSYLLEMVEQSVDWDGLTSR